MSQPVLQPGDPASESPRRRLKRRLAAREPIAGISPEHASPSLVEVLGRSGFDLIFIDCEPGGPGIERVADMARAARAAGTVSVLRPWSTDPGLIRRYLACGIDGLILPETETVAQIESVRAAIAAASPPDAENLLLIPLIESVAGIANAAEILRADGVDAIQVGPGDLAVSMGLPRYGGHRRVAEAMFDVFGLARRLGKSAGGPPGNLGIRGMADAGGNFVMFFANSLLRQAAQAALAAVRGAGP